MFFHPSQYLIAWDPDKWKEVRSDGIKLSHTRYFKPDGSEAQLSEAAVSILSDMQGRTLTVMSYHLPAGVQVENQPERRIQVTKESMQTMEDIGRNAETKGVLFGGDDNIDETKGHGPWGYMLRPQTGLKQTQAPRATHGKVRAIDDFRTKRLQVHEPGQVRDGGGDHKVHIRKFSWLGN
jgi:hypothetical protein